jgi:predicted Zn-dependent protease
MRHRPISVAIALVASALWLGGTGCASSPKSRPAKPKRVVLSTEYDDARAGREASVDVKKELGVLGDDELDAYVSEIGRKLLRGVPRKSFDYQFSVIDQEEPNAFALPGGYIFVSRGLLYLANDEDELACVLGHEIIHAANRHAAAQQALSRSINPLAMPWNRAASMAAYGRDMEREADKGGQILCAAAGYDPMAMSTFLESLEQYQRLRKGYSRRPSFFDTHPGTTERVASNAVRAGEIRWRRDPSIGDPRNSLLDQIDGLPVGQRPETGIFVGSSFIHPVLDFHIRFPQDLQQRNANQAVGAMEPRGQAVIYLTAGKGGGTAQQMAEAWVERAKQEQRVEVKDSRPVKIGSLDAWRMRLEMPGRGVRVASTVTFIPYRDATWRVTGTSRAMSAEKYLGRTLSTARSFRPLSLREKRSIKTLRLRSVEARRGENVIELTRRTGNAWSPATTAVNNGIFVDHRFEGGERVKIATVELFVPGIR